MRSTTITTKKLRVSVPSSRRFTDRIRDRLRPLLTLPVTLVALLASASAFAEPATLQISDSTLDFGYVAAGETSVRTVTLTHPGPGDADPIDIQATSMDELDSLHYTADFYGPVTLYPGESLALSVLFSPDVDGNHGADYPASLFITHTGSPSLARVQLSGRSGEPVLPLEYRAAPKISFGKSTLDGIGSIAPTSLQFGPDGRLYVADMMGTLKVYTVQRSGANDYSVIATETIQLIRNLPNHDDDGDLNNSVTGRLVTGLLVTGTASKPVVYVASSDPRIGGGNQHTDTNLDTNSTILSRLDRSGNSWLKTDLVRGLPRSEENHHANGMALSGNGNTLYLAMGGNTNAGAKSNNFALLPEFALSAAILEIDLAAIGNSTYDLPTLDDEDRSGANDANDPFGGNQGKNQAKLVAGGPVQVYAPGFRNAYDVLLASNGKMYSVDNGPNAGWGAPPSNCKNNQSEPGNTHPDSLHHITGKGYYGGHANPTRGSKTNKFNSSNPQSPVSSANSVECNYKIPGSGNGALLTFPASTNGLTEYTASNFGGLLQGNLLAAAWNNKIYRIELNSSGTSATQLSTLFSTVGTRPLDVTALGDQGPFPGTIWVADFTEGKLFVFEPTDYAGATGGSCDALPPNADDDDDGFSNADELSNGTDPCSAADLPPDNDGDYISDLTDNDDDNDGVADVDDAFAIDATNGNSQSLPFHFEWENSSSPPGGLMNLGFTGLMTNGVDTYESLFDPDQMTISGAAGVLTVDSVPAGDAFKGKNSQQYGFQLGIPVNTSSPPFRVHTRVLAPFAGMTPSQYQSMGLFLGTGDQDNYVKLVINAVGSTGGLQFLSETNGGNISKQQLSAAVFGADSIDLYLTVTPVSLSVTASFQVTKNGSTGPMLSFGTPLSLQSAWLNNALAVGILSTSSQGSPFAATWDMLAVDILLDDEPVNTPPVVDAGASGTALTGVAYALDATVTDDGPVQTLWTLTSGPGSATFDNSLSVDATVVFSAAGSYVLTLIADDGAQSRSDTVTIVVTDEPVDEPTPGTVIYRINAGGPLLSAAGGDFVPDSGNGYQYYNTGKSASSSVPVDITGMPAGVPAALFQTERFDPLRAPDLFYSLPVTPGDYLVRLYFAETSSGAFAVGARVFDVDVEGTLLGNVDIFAEAGADKALMKSVVVTADNLLTIAFDAKSQKSKIMGIEIIAIDGGSTPLNQAPVVAAGTDRTVAAGVSLQLLGTVSDDGLPDGTLDSEWQQIDGPATVVLNPIDSPLTQLVMDVPGSYTFELTATDGELTTSDSVTIDVVADTDPPPVSAIRINVGGPALSDPSGDWLSDSATSDWVNTGWLYGKSVSVDTSTLSDPVPSALFQTERYDKPSAPVMQWQIPVTPGDYEVRLYFAEIWKGAWSIGGRVFSVAVEDTTLSSIDVFAEVGAKAALMRSVVVTSDELLTIQFTHEVQNPALKGIEIVPLGAENT